MSSEFRLFLVMDSHDSYAVLAKSEQAIHEVMEEMGNVVRKTWDRGPITQDEIEVFHKFGMLHYTGVDFT